MKIRNYILGLFASVAVLAGCEQEQELGPASLRTLEDAVTLPLEGGEKTITLKATRPWTATVSPSDASITVTPSSGQGSNDPVIVTVTAGKNASRNLNGKITFTSGSMKPVVVTVTQPGELGALYYADEIYSLANDTEVIVEGLVVGVNTKGCVIKDETGLVLAYNGSSTAAPSSVGKKVKVEGKVGIYGDLKQVAYTKLTEDPAAAVEVNHGEPVVADAAYLNAPKLDRVYYMTLTGVYKPSADKKYHNVLVEGASKQGSLQYPIQDLTSAVDHNVKFHGYFTGVNSGNYYTFLVTSFEDLGELVIDMSTIAQVLEKSVGTSVKTQGTVAAVNQSSIVLKDNTRVIYVYLNAAPGVKVGDDVEVSGLRDNYNGLDQISSPTITAKGTTSQVDYGTPESIKTSAALDAYMASWEAVEYVEVEGVVDGYYVYPSDAAEGANGVSPYYYDGDLAVYDGKTVTLCGYSIGKNKKGDKLNVVVTEIKTDPFIAAEDVSVLATATSAKIGVVSNVEWTVATDASWVTYTKSTDGIDVTFEANTSETDDRVATFTLSAEGVTPVTVTLTQNKKGIVVAGEVTDLIDQAFAGLGNTTTYKDWSNKPASSSAAVYSGNSAGETEFGDIRIRTDKSNSGVVSTASGGRLKKVVITWNNKTYQTKKITVYGSNNAYTAATDLFGENKGEVIGEVSFTKDSGAFVTEVVVPEDKNYQYVGIRSNDGVCYLDKIEITWEN